MSSDHPAGTTNGALIDHSEMPPAREAITQGEHVQMDLPKVSGAVGVLIGVVVLVLLGALFFLGWAPHSHKLAAAQTDANETTGATPFVDVIAPKVGKTDDVLMLPADIRPNQMTAIFARASGYLKPLPAGIDIGAHVEAGQVIAEIAAPDVDAQLEQSKAALEQAKVASVRAEQEYALNQSTLTRYEEALKNKAVSEQDVEERRTQQSVGQSALMEARANVVALDAAVKRLVELQGFQKVTAPFSGVLTFRGYDTGALISPGDSTGKELFRLEQSEVLRASANVPQSFATDIKIGQTAEILVRNYPEREFPGTIARSAGSVDTATRTMRVEVDVANKDAALLPGMYGQIRFHIHRDRPALTLPTSALVFGAEGVRIVVMENGHAKYRSVTLGRDLGVEVEVVAGLAAAESVVNNPGALMDGVAVVAKAK